VNAYKFLRSGRIAPFSGFVWPLDDAVETEGPPEPCRRGVHACTAADLSYWVADELWVIALEGEIVEDEHKVVATQGRLVERVDAWNDDARRSYAGECARRTIQHAVEELRDAGLGETAAALAGAKADAVADAALAAADAAYDANRPNAAILAELAADAARGVDVAPPATMAFVAAHAADSRSNASERDLFADERQVQSAWLAKALGLSEDAA
jgi:hypothetical protein